MFTPSGAIDEVLIRNAEVLDDPSINRPAGPRDVLVRDGVIAEIGVGLQTTGLVVDGSDGIVVAGMTDTHRHTWQSVVRGLTADYSAMQYYKSIRWGVATDFTAEDVYYGNLIGALDMIDAGVTQVVDFSHCINTPEHADAAYQGLADSGIRAFFAYGFNDVPLDRPAFTTHQQRVDDFRRVHSAYAGKNPRITVGVSLSDFAQTGLEPLKIEIAVAREMGVPITLHPGAIRPKTDFGTISILQKEGLLGPDMILAHCTNATDDELLMLRDAGSWVSTTPETETQMGMGFPITGRLLEKGMKPTLGVDVVSDCSGDLFHQMRLALQTERALRQVSAMAHPPTPSCGDLLTIATAHGAEAAGGAANGRLEVGAAADLMLLKPRAFELSPVVDPIASAVLHADAANVELVLIDGKPLKQGGQLTGVDVPALRHAATRISRRLVGAWDARGGLDSEAPEVERVTRARLDR